MDLDCIDRQVVCVVQGEIDIATAHHLRSAGLDAMDEHHPRLILDLSQVTFMDCAGLSVLVLLRNEATARGGQMTLTGTPGNVARLLRLGKLDSAFGLADADASS
jgi:anti-anti-sigma factor